MDFLVKEAKPTPGERIAKMADCKPCARALLDILESKINMDRKVLDVHEAFWYAEEFEPKLLADRIAAVESSCAIAMPNSKLANQRRLDNPEGAAIAEGAPDAAKRAYRNMTSQEGSDSPPPLMGNPLDMLSSAIEEDLYQAYLKDGPPNPLLYNGGRP